MKRCSRGSRLCSILCVMLCHCARLGRLRTYSQCQIKSHEFGLFLFMDYMGRGRGCVLSIGGNWVYRISLRGEGDRRGRKKKFNHTSLHDVCVMCVYCECECVWCAICVDGGWGSVYHQINTAKAVEYSSQKAMRRTNRASE